MSRISYADIFPWTSGQDFADELSSRGVAVKVHLNKAVENQGAWSSTTNYNANDLVVHAGTDYRALTASLNVTPGTDGTKWKSIGSGEAPAQPFIQHVAYTGTPDLHLIGSDDDATLAPGSVDESDILDVLELVTGLDRDDFAVSDLDTTAPVGATVTISGAGAGAVNADYPEDAVVNGAPSYRKTSGGMYVYWNSSMTRWVIATNTSSGGIYYRSATQGSALPFPATGWTTYTSDSYGSDPAPTVALDTDDVAEGTLSFTYTYNGTGDIEALTSDTSGAVLTIIQFKAAAGVAASQNSLVAVNEAWQAAVRGIGSQKPISVHQEGHGITFKSAPIVCTGDNTYAIAGADGLDVVGYSLEIIDADNFTFWPIGPVAAVEYGATGGNLQYAYSGHIGQVGLPPDPGDEYVVWGIALNTTDVVVVSRPVQTVPTVPTITGSRGGNAALADLLTKLAAAGLIVDSTT